MKRALYMECILLYFIYMHAYALISIILYFHQARDYSFEKNVQNYISIFERVLFFSPMDFKIACSTTQTRLRYVATRTIRLVLIKAILGKFSTFLFRNKSRSAYFKRKVLLLGRVLRNPIWLRAFQLFFAVQPAFILLQTQRKVYLSY